MTKGDILIHYKKLSTEEKGVFKRWLVGNAVAGVAFTGALLLFAEGGWRSDETASSPNKPAMQIASFQELHALAHQENLPVQHFHDLTLIFTALDTETQPAILAQGNTAGR
jgi:hypothetical protein